ncbi:hypothetical protein [Polycladidibacter hongkongensis]|uniref:hypothetical protein n=1 Tax=Polycladidibacter hongkongensis TaxID=1647556 RepID=UPI00082D48E4|nr:hypothetical protein [Pseudovibrio hongkongensis]
MSKVASSSTTLAPPVAPLVPASSDGTSASKDDSGKGASPAPAPVTAAPTEPKKNVWDVFLSELSAAAPAKDKPMLYMPGTLAHDANKDKWTTYVNSVLGDPAAAVTPEMLPANFNSPTPAEFAGWHSAIQLKYMQDKIPQAQQNSGNAYIEKNGQKIGVILSEDGRRVIIVDQLDKSRIMRMSRVEQERLVNNTQFLQVASRLGLSPNAEAPTVNVKVVQDTIVNVELNKIKAAVPSKASSAQQSRFAEDKKVYEKQLQMLNDEISNMRIYSPRELQAKVAAIKKRFDRAFNAINIPEPSNTAQLNTASNVVSADGNASIKKAYNVYIAQEKRILALAESSKQMLSLGGISSDGSGNPLTVRKLDVPTIVAMLQNQASLKKQAIIAMRTQQLTQLNTLSQAYSEMQRLVNETLKQFVATGKKAEEEKHKLKLPEPMSTFTKTVIQMFNQDTAGLNHPVEVDYKVTRPTNKITKYTEKTVLDYDGMRTKIYDYVERMRPLESLGGIVLSGSGTSVTPATTGAVVKSEISDAELAAASPSITVSAYGKKYTIQTAHFLAYKNVPDTSMPFTTNNLKDYSRTQWEKFSTQLSDAVTQLNPQLLTNDINQDNREQNRLYEQATSTIRRAFDLNMQIARSLA